MLNYRISSFSFFLFFSFLHAQNIKTVDTVFVRYNGEISNDYRFNTIKLYELQGDTIYNVTEIYKFTNPISVRSQHQENLQREKHGYYRKRYANGVISEIGNYFNGKKDGTWKTYRNDSLKSRYFYKDGNREGRSYHYFSGENYYVKNWKNDKLNGRVEEYNSKGVLVFEGQYDEGIMFGVNKWYFSSGEKWKEENYSNSKPNGLYMEWYKNGNLYCKGNYKDGKMVGDWRWYRNNGKIASEENYSDKGKIKKAVFYDEYGNKSNGKRHLIDGVANEKQRLKSTIMKYVRDHFTYPKEMLERGFEGRVFVSFKIDKQGFVTDLKTRADAHDVLIKKAEEIVKSLPKQKPAVAHNIVYEERFGIPIVFRIPD